MSERRGRRKPAVPVLPRARVGYFLVARQGEERDAEHVEVECCGRVPSVVEQRPSMTCGEQHRQRTRNHAGFRQLVTDVSDAQRLCRQRRRGQPGRRRGCEQAVRDSQRAAPGAFRPHGSERAAARDDAGLVSEEVLQHHAGGVRPLAPIRCRAALRLASARPSRLQAADREAETAAKPEHPVAVQIEARKRNGQRQDEQRDRSDHLMADQPAPG